MNDLLFYTDDWDSFLEEAYLDDETLVGKDVETGEYYLKYPSTPTVSNEAGETMWLVRAGDGQVGQFARLSSTTNLGSYTAVLKTPPKRAIYDRIYNQTPYEIEDPDGNNIVITPPEKFGVFTVKALETVEPE